MTLDEAIKHAEEVAEREYENAQVYDKTKNNNLHHPDKITCEQAAERCRECATEHRQLAEWLKDYKRLLEQEPCEDCINREETLKALMDEWTEFDSEIIDSLVEKIKKLPPVKPTEKVGQWIDDNKDEIDAQYGRHLYRCQICNKYAEYFVGGTEDWWDIEKPNYCPSCGAKMQEVEK